MALKVTGIFQSTPSWRGRPRFIVYIIPFSCISIHALMKRATGNKNDISNPKLYFNPRTHEEGDKTYFNEFCAAVNFNPRPHEEGDVCNSFLPEGREPFQSTPSWRGRHHIFLFCNSFFVFQSTPSWRGRLITSAWQSGQVTISIHALMKRATGHVQIRHLPQQISIHALMKRATKGTTKPKQSMRFQSTPSWRGRLSTPHYTEWDYSISIHALMKRATHLSLWPVRPLSIFQSTPSWRGRLGEDWRVHRQKYFNPRPHEEGDWFKFWQFKTLRYFNPRPHEEGDSIVLLLILFLIVFQSTPSWRGRPGISKYLSPLRYFNPRPREEGDEVQAVFGGIQLLFQSTPSWRGRPRKYLRGIIL